jgi:hypothetical protein
MPKLAALQSLRRFGVTLWMVFVDLLLWAWAIARFVMDWVGRSTFLEDAGSAEQKAMRWLEWLLGTPWPVPAALAALATAFSAFVFWREHTTAVGSCEQVQRSGSSGDAPAAETLNQSSEPVARRHVPAFLVDPIQESCKRHIAEFALRALRPAVEAQVAALDDLSVLLQKVSPDPSMSEAKITEIKARLKTNLRLIDLAEKAWSFREASLEDLTQALGEASMHYADNRTALEQMINLITARMSLPEGVKASPGVAAGFLRRRAVTQTRMGEWVSLHNRLIDEAGGLHLKLSEAFPQPGLIVPTFGSRLDDTGLL